MVCMQTSQPAYSVGREVRINLSVYSSSNFVIAEKMVVHEIPWGVYACEDVCMQIMLSWSIGAWNHAAIVSERIAVHRGAVVVS